MTNREIAASSKLIIKKFPNEKVELWYIERSGRTYARGILYDKDVNEISNFRKQNVRTVSTATLRTVNNLPNSALEEITDNDVDGHEHEPNWMWLKHNNEPWTKVTERWRLTFEIRKNYIRKSNSGEIIQMWPLYANTLGHSLVEIDFSILFPEKENNLVNNWNEYKRKAKNNF